MSVRNSFSPPPAGQINWSFYYRTKKMNRGEKQFLNSVRRSAAQHGYLVRKIRNIGLFTLFDPEIHAGWVVSSINEIKELLEFKLSEAATPETPAREPWYDAAF